jgi:hypothetical protein
MTGSKKGDTQFAAFLEERFVDNRGKEPPFDVVEGSMIPEVFFPGLVVNPPVMCYLLLSYYSINCIDCQC